MAARILHVVTNVAHYDAPSHPTGLWLSELTHAWEVFADADFDQELASPSGGAVPLEPRSLKFPNDDKTAKAWRADPTKMALLNDTASTAEVDSSRYDAIYLTGGHAVMYDFLNDDGLQRITREIFERGDVVSSVCHGYCGLLNTTLTDGSYLIAQRRITGFSWREEGLARVADLVPYNAEELAKERGANYTKARLPFVSNVVADGNLITGQNPGSARATARAVVAALTPPGSAPTR
ncbi:type 1 glutamine amidotransferase domain-containing protein [Nocardioides sp. Bht2]|uniref:type 1 glutamine amidotransferase domain-containing protein n=1 Tax=Nocardioides sp. Bht2 TaxID=3392297 RepID=UPI0039B5B4EB